MMVSGATGLAVAVVVAAAAVPAAAITFELSDPAGCIDRVELTRELQARVAAGARVSLNVVVEPGEQHVVTLRLRVDDHATSERRLPVLRAECADAPLLVASIVGTEVETARALMMRRPLKPLDVDAVERTRRVPALSSATSADDTASWSLHPWIGARGSALGFPASLLIAVVAGTDVALPINGDGGAGEVAPRARALVALESGPPVPVGQRPDAASALVLATRGGIGGALPMRLSEAAWIEPSLALEAGVATIAGAEGARGLALLPTAALTAGVRIPLSFGFIELGAFVRPLRVGIRVGAAKYEEPVVGATFAVGAGGGSNRAAGSGPP